MPADTHVVLVTGMLKASKGRDAQELPLGEHLLTWKNSAPSWLASRGMCSRIASRTRQCLSSASSSIAGSKLCASSSMPMTWFTCATDTQSATVTTQEQGQGQAGVNKTNKLSTHLLHHGHLVLKGVMACIWLLGVGPRPTNQGPRPTNHQPGLMVMRVFAFLLQGHLQ